MADYGSELANIVVAFSILGIMGLGLVWVLIREFKRKE